MKPSPAATGAGAGTLPLFARFVAKAMGLHFTEERHQELRHKMAALAREAGHSEVENYLLWLMSAPLSREQLETLAGALTIGETYFLRDPKSYLALEKHVLPELVASRRNGGRSLKIWSAGCSSGEEPYSLAILLTRVIPDIADWNISLVATDLNPQALERGRCGLYRQWSFRNAPPWLMEYFTRREDGQFEVAPRIRAMVRFDHLNLVEEDEDPSPRGMDALDIIFCRNVMLYFEPEQIVRTVARFRRALASGGALFVGPTEVDQRFMKGFECHHYDGALVFRKGSEHTNPARDGHPLGPALPPLHGAGRGAAGVAGGGTSHGKGAPSGKKDAVPHPRAHPVSAAPPRRPEAGAGRPATDAGGGSGEAAALYQAGKYLEAAESVRRSREAGALPAETLALGARAYANIGKFPEARELCQQAIAADRLDARSHYLLSIILEQLGDLAGCATSLKHAIFIDHDFLLAYFALGNLCLQSGDGMGAERNFGTALRLLERRDPCEVLPEAEGLTAGRLAQIIGTLIKGRRNHGTE